MTTPYVRASACGEYIVAAFGSAYPIVMPIVDAAATRALYIDDTRKATESGNPSAAALSRTMADMIGTAITDAESFRSARIQRATTLKRKS